MDTADTKKTEAKQGEEGKAGNPFFAAPKSKKMLTLVGIYICLVGCIFQSATASTLLPMAAREIGGLDYYSLANTLSGAVGVIAMPLWGLFGAKNPAIKKPLFVVSMVCGLVCLVGRAVAGDMTFMIVVSLFWGLPSAGLYVIGYSMMRDMYDSKTAGMYLGICATMQSIGMLAGPVVGGLVMDFASWRAACVLIAVIIAVGTVMVFFGVGATKQQAVGMATATGKFDAPGSLAVVVCLGCLICGLSLGTSFLPFGSMSSNIVFILAAAALVVLVFVVAKKKDSAVVPLSALKNRNTLLFTAGSFFSMFSNMAIFFFIPMYAISAMGLSATEADLTTSMLSIVGLFMGPILGRMIGKAGNARGVLAVGSLLRILIALALMFFLAPDLNIFVLYVILFVGGFYNVTFGVVFSAGPQIQLPAKIRMQGNSVIQLGQNFGGSVGTAIYTIILASFGVVAGMPIALTISAVAAGVALVCSLFLKKLEGQEQG